MEQRLDFLKSSQFLFYNSAPQGLWTAAFLGLLDRFSGRLHRQTARWIRSSATGMQPITQPAPEPVPSPRGATVPGGPNVKCPPWRAKLGNRVTSASACHPAPPGPPRHPSTKWLLPETPARSALKCWGAPYFNALRSKPRLQTPPPNGMSNHSRQRPSAPHFLSQSPLA